MARIVLQTPDGQMFESELNAAHLTVGRTSDNDIIIPDASVSSSHGEFTHDGSVWSFTDLGSTNGTKINGERVQTLELGNGAQFEIGNVATTFYEDVEVSHASHAPAQANRSAGAPADGYGSRAIERAARVGFGPKKPVKDSARSMLVMLGVIGLIAVLGVGAMIFTGGL
jgi:predicted component of type VI protein secretion system